MLITFTHMRNVAQWDFAGQRVLLWNKNIKVRLETRAGQRRFLIDRKPPIPVVHLTIKGA